MSEKEPPKAPGNRELVSKRLDVARNKPGAKETVTVEWRGQQKSIEVIDIPVDALYYNPETHRIRAQLSLDPQRYQVLQDSPWSQESQEYLHALLMGEPGDPLKIDPRFEELKQDLQDHGQTDPGIITPSGILVNGNTRRAALREIGSLNIRVGVLDDDWSWGDLNAVELSLQLRKDLKREYSFLNYLLAVQEQLSQGRSEADVAKEFRQKATTIARARWILAFINEAITRSETLVNDSSAKLRLIDFEGHKGKLEELYGTYTKVQATDPDGAETLRETRLVALLVEKAKTDNRLIDQDFFETYLSPQIKGIDVDPPASTSAEVKIPGLTATVMAPSKSAQRAKSLADKVLKAVAVSRSKTAPPAEAQAASSLLDQVSSAMEQSLDKAGRSTRLKKAKQAAPDRLQMAAEEVRQCSSEVASARAGAGLDDDALDDAASDLRDAIRDLAEQVQRTTTVDRGPGLGWLLAAAVAEGE